METNMNLLTIRQLLEKTEDFQIIAGIFRQLGDMNRIRIFWLLCHMEECVVNIAAMLDMSSPAVSHHLRALKDSGLIESRREGKEVYYKAAGIAQSQLLHQMIELIMEIACPELESLPDPLDHRHSDMAADEVSCPSSYEAGSSATAHNSGCGESCCHRHSPGNTEERSHLNAFQTEQLSTIRAIHEQLSQHLDQRWNIEELARQHLMNPTTLKMLFKAEYGTSIAAHIREHRMEEAGRLLKETTDSIAEIAAAVGYTSQSKFTAAFKDFFGVLPRDYRKN